MEKKGHRAWTPTEKKQAAIREAKVQTIRTVQPRQIKRTGNRSLRLLVPVREDEGKVNIIEKEGKEVKPVSYDNESQHVTINTAKAHDSDCEFLLYEEDENVGGLISALCPEVMVRVCGVETRVFSDSGTEISCVSEELVTELEGKVIQLAYLNVPRIKIVGVRSRKGPRVNRQTVLTIEGIGEPKKFITPDDSKSLAILPDKWQVTDKFVRLLKLDYPIFQLYNTTSISVPQSLNEEIVQDVA
ncbi:hypothetical protein PR048_002162 [Dryococelus australis]|uniref:Uncharacterized protein n=1 Tax=Dryococelus australis TaxID=614101 RepID=A0ABQ9IJK2_9NEOP|nr:hypothetical protein PR048_002162 [Dryococelus australis]